MMFTSERVIPVAIVVFAMFLQASIHKIHEGHVGVYYIGGRLLDVIILSNNMVVCDERCITGVHGSWIQCHVPIFYTSA